MSDRTTVFRRDRSGSLVLFVLCFFLLVAAPTFWVLRPQIPLPPAVAEHVPTAVAVVAGLAGLGMLISAVILNDGSPKLTVDELGLTDHRARGGPRNFAWGEIQSVDCEVTRLNNSVTKAKMTLYVVTRGVVEDVKVNVKGLERGPKAVFAAVKKEWIQFNYDHGRQVRDDE